MAAIENFNNRDATLAERAALDSREVEQFLLTPEAYRIISSGSVRGKGLAEPGRPEAIPTFDAVIEVALAGNEPLEVVPRRIPEAGKQWIVTLKNYPYVAIFVSSSKKDCETVVRNRKLP